MCIPWCICNSIILASGDNLLILQLSDWPVCHSLPHTLACLLTCHESINSCPISDSSSLVFPYDLEDFAFERILDESRMVQTNPPIMYTCCTHTKLDIQLFCTAWVMAWLAHKDDIPDMKLMVILFPATEVHIQKVLVCALLYIPEVQSPQSCPSTALVHKTTAHHAHGNTWFILQNHKAFHQPCHHLGEQTLHWPTTQARL